MFGRVRFLMLLLERRTGFYSSKLLQIQMVEIESDCAEREGYISGIGNEFVMTYVVHGGCMHEFSLIYM